jgi:hypothetical protein
MRNVPGPREDNRTGRRLHIDVRTRAHADPVSFEGAKECPKR